MRRLLLWMASNQWLRRRLPQLWFSRRAVARFMPGEDAPAAIAAAEAFAHDGLGVLFTYLGENVLSLDDADSVAEEYVGLVTAIAARPIDGEISVKLTQLGLDVDREACVNHMARLAELAARAHQTVWIDMESSKYVERTIDCYEDLRARHDNVGICLQAYLRRTASDLQRLIPLDPTVRLVKGAYAEPSSIAYTSRREVDANYLALAVEMLHAKQQGHSLRLGLGTHDIGLIEQACGHALAIGLPKASFEVQMLYGIRVDEQKRLARDGYVVRDLIAYGAAWYPWYFRRLAERPANVLFALRQIVP